MPPPATPAAYATPPTAPSSRSNTAVIVILVLVIAIVVVIAVVAVVFVGAFSAPRGDCVTVVDGTESRFPNHTQSQCESFCSGFPFGDQCFWDPYAVRFRRLPTG